MAEENKGKVPVLPVIIPSYEPDDRLPELLSKLSASGLTPVVLVDDGSGPECGHYFEEAEKDPEITVLRHDRNMGKGRALKTAFAYCLKAYPEMTGCITADSDGQHTPDSIQACRQALLEHPDELVLGVRDFGQEDVPEKSQFGNRLTIRIFRWLYRTEISDTQTGLRGIPKRFMEDLLNVPGDRFEFETRMLTEAIEKKIGFREVPIATVYDSKENHTTHYKPFRDSMRIAKVFIGPFFRFLLSSLSSSVLDLLLFALFCRLFRGTPGYVALATVSARVFSAVYNYLVNYYLVFRSNAGHTHSAGRYVLLAVLQMASSALLVTAFVGLLRPSRELFVKVPVDAVLFLVSFVIQKRKVFK